MSVRVYYSKHDAYSETDWVKFEVRMNGLVHAWIRGGWRLYADKLSELSKPKFSEVVHEAYEWEYIHNDFLLAMPNNMALKQHMMTHSRFGSDAFHWGEGANTFNRWTDIDALKRTIKDFVTHRATKDGWRANISNRR